MWFDWWQAWFDRADAADRRPLSELRMHLLLALLDCPEPDAVALRYTIISTLGADRLWLLRSDVFHCVAHRHGEAEAARRVSALLPLYRGWVAPALLTPVKVRGVAGTGRATATATATATDSRQRPTQRTQKSAASDFPSTQPEHRTWHDTLQ